MLPASTFQEVTEMQHRDRIVLSILAALAVLAAGCGGAKRRPEPTPTEPKPTEPAAAALTPQMVELEKGAAETPAPKTRGTRTKAGGPRSKGPSRPRRSEQIRQRARKRIRTYKQNLRNIEQTRRDLAQPGAHRAATRRELEQQEARNRQLREQIHQDYVEWRQALKEERGH
jgi:hypothetical protein